MDFRQSEPIPTFTPLVDLVAILSFRLVRTRLACEFCARAASELLTLSFESVPKRFPSRPWRPFHWHPLPNASFEPAQPARLFPPTTKQCPTLHVLSPPNQQHQQQLAYPLALPLVQPPPMHLLPSALLALASLQVVWAVRLPFSPESSLQNRQKAREVYERRQARKRDIVRRLKDGPRRRQTQSVLDCDHPPLFRLTSDQSILMVPSFSLSLACMVMKDVCWDVYRLAVCRVQQGRGQ